MIEPLLAFYFNAHFFEEFTVYFYIMIFQILVVATAMQVCWMDAVPTRTHSWWPKCNAAVIVDAAGLKAPLLNCAPFVDQVGLLSHLMGLVVFCIASNFKLKYQIFIFVCIHSCIHSFIHSCDHFRRLPETMHPNTRREWRRADTWPSPRESWHTFHLPTAISCSTYSWPRANSSWSYSYSGSTWPHTRTNPNPNPWPVSCGASSTRLVLVFVSLQFFSEFYAQKCFKIVSSWCILSDTVMEPCSAWHCYKDTQSIPNVQTMLYIKACTVCRPDIG